MRAREEVRVHDFLIKELGRAVPYGVYDIAANAGWVSVGMSADTAGFASGRSVQCHGGIGFTWEAYVHLYFKRQTHSQLLWGDGPWHRARLASMLMPAQSE